LPADVEAVEDPQECAKKNPLGYKMYKKGSGRTDYINQNWNENINQQ